MTRPSNQSLAANFRRLLTDRAAETMDAATLDATKPYRAELWRAFAEIERRLDPVKEMLYERGE